MDIIYGQNLGGNVTPLNFLNYRFINIAPLTGEIVEHLRDGYKICMKLVITLQLIFEWYYGNRIETILSAKSLSKIYNMIK